MCSRLCWVFGCSVKAWHFRLAQIRKTVVIFSCPVSSQPGMCPPTPHPLVTLLHYLETQNWGSEVPSAGASSASCRMIWYPWCAITSQQPFAKETVYHRHPHEASWNLSPGGCICPVAFPGSTPPGTLKWDFNALNEVCMCGRRRPHSEVGGCICNMAELIKIGPSLCLPSCKCFCLDPG